MHSSPPGPVAVLTPGTLRAALQKQAGHSCCSFPDMFREALKLVL